MIGEEEKKAVVDLFPFLAEHPIVLDIGSNKGMWADIFLSEYKDKCFLHLFEPNEMLLNYTKIRFEYDNNITYNDLACYSKSGEKIPFYYFVNYNNELSSIYKGGSEWDGLPMKEKLVDTITIDEYCKTNGIETVDYLKIDSEGADVDILLGCKQLITEGRVKIFQVEYGGHYPRANHTFQEVIDLFKNTGYKIYYFAEGNYWELTNFSEDYAARDFIITKEEIRNHSVGWNNEFIINTMELPKFDLVGEVGAFEGLTTKYICEKLLNPGGRVVVIDPLEEYYIEGDTEHPQFKGQYPRFIRNTRGMPVELKRGKSEQELPKLHSLRFDLIYVDGDHRKDPVYFDLCWSFAVCKLQGFILIDDYTWRPETTEGIDKFLNEFSGSFDLVTKGYQVLIRKHTNQYNELTYNFYV